MSSKNTIYHIIIDSNIDNKYTNTTEITLYKRDYMKHILTIICVFFLLFSCNLITQDSDKTITNDTIIDQEVPTKPSISGSTIIHYDTVIENDVLLANIDFLKSQKIYFEHASIGGNMFGYPYYGNGTNNNTGAKGLYELYSENNTFLFNLSKNKPNMYSITNGTLSFGDGVEEMYRKSFTIGHLKDGGFLRVHRGNPTTPSNPSNYLNPKVELFQNLNNDIIEQADILMMKFCYSDYYYASYNNNYNVTPQSFAQDYFDVYEALQERAKTLNPDAKFIFWTIPLVKKDYVSDAGTKYNRYIQQGRDEVNNLIRQYCKDNNQYLIDIADIESHAPDGSKLLTAKSETVEAGLDYMHDSYTYDYGHLDGAFAKEMTKVFLHTVLVMNGKIAQ